jgi:hypothetical protein
VASSPGLSHPPPYPPPLAGEGRVGDGTVPDYWDGRDIRAFTPVFDGLLRGHDQVGLQRVLLRRHGRPKMARRRRATTPRSRESGLFCRRGVHRVENPTWA